MTLLEVVIAAFMLLTMLGVLTLLVVPSIRNSQAGMARSWMQQQAFLVLDKVGDDLQRTARQGVSYSPGPPVQLGMVRLLDVTPESTQVWERKAVLYTLESGVLRRQVVRSLEATNPDATAPQQLTPGTLQELASSTDPEAESRVLARSVTDFLVAVDTSRHPDCPVSLTVGVERRTQAKEPERFRVSRTISVRNRP